MPVYSFLRCDPPCPYCDRSLAPIYSYNSFMVRFNWGYTDARLPTPENTYEVGDEIRWRNKNGVVTAWSSFQGLGFNVGDPQTPYVAASDFGAEGSLRGLPCPACHHVLGGSLVFIKQNVIESVQVVSKSFEPSTGYPEHLANAPDNFLVTPNGLVGILEPFPYTFVE